MTSTYDLFGRTNQKRRTRLALMAAAAELMRGGLAPTVAQVADAALVSKSTAYRYFPSQDALLAELQLDQALGSDLEAPYAAARTPGSVATRLDAVVRADHTLVVTHAAAFRGALRVMLANASDDAGVPRRPGNRLRYLAEALESLQEVVRARPLERLVMALAMCVGVESVVVLQDICGLTPAEAEAVKRWAASALLEVTLREAGAGVA